ncbi:MAG: FadR family transcriptional regulator [Spirochaetaceae bacterium]|jgi:DNA-binding FadR family transcriptional regulator|nr:FadR family transcriptional regulator [Spirochaetaceae bacterium]
MGKQPKKDIMLSIPENLLTLRRRLKLSQKDFIQAYLSDETGTPLISVPTLSNIENGSTTGVTELADRVAKKMRVDGSVFLEDPDHFAKNIELFFGDALEAYRPAFREGGKKRSATEVLVETISDYLMDAVIRGELRPGSRLPPDRKLGVLFGAGRSAVREALKVLSTLGIITILPGHGTFIAAESSGFLHLPLSWTFLIGDNPMEHLIDVRNVLEIESARRAAEKADAASLDKLEQIYTNMMRAFQEANFKNFLDQDIDFHVAIAACSQNPIISDLLATSRKILTYISKSGMVTMEDLRSIYAEHSNIYTAITARDPAMAKQMMETHLANARLRYHLNTAFS